MGGRAWYSGPIGLTFDLFCPEFEPRRSLNDYCGGIMDSLDGSHGFTFTYLPVVFEDDCQVCDSSSNFHVCEGTLYRIRIDFLQG